MEFEHANSEELKHEETQVELNGGLVDAHFSLDDLFVSANDYASSISSASPPQEWPQPQSWNKISQNNGGEIDSSLFNAPLSGNGPVHAAFDENMFDFGGLGMNNMIIDMSSNLYNQDMPITLQPSELHKSPQEQYHFIPPAMMSVAQSNNSENAATHNQDNDIAAVVKRLTGITNAQIAGDPNAFAADPYAIPAGFSDNSYSSASSDRSSVPPQTIEPTQPLTPASEGVPAEGVSLTSGARPKTAHTTIERRYRTNLNTCIVGLRNSIPAVRYLDKSHKHATGVQDKPDERGLIDGVKAARKISKATIMSKAREYIVVLKRRETRLQNEVNAMKDLLGSLVNGPVLVKAFEAEWAARQAAEAADDEMDSGDMDSEDEDEDSADERPRKKAKVSPALAPIAPVKPKKAPAAPRPSTAGAQAGGAEEARPKKRGRPPKNAAANAARASPPSQPVHFTAPISTTASPVTPHATQQQFSFVPVVPQQQKRPAYLLAGFVFLSFFKPSPREVGIVPSDEGTNHSHLGRVLSSQDENPFGTVVESAWHSHPVLHVAHTALMIALFVALAVSLSPQSTKNKLWRYLDRLTSSAPAVEEQLDEKDSTMTPLERAEKELKSVSSNTKSKLRAFTLLQAIPTPTSEQLALMALLRFASKPSQATDLWAEAASCSDASNPTTVAFELPLETACTVMQEAASSRDHRSPLIIVASKALETRFEQTLKDAFVNDVSAICDKSYTPISSSEASKRAAAQEELVTRSFALGGRPAELVKTWEQACTGRADASSTSNNNDDSTGAVLIRVLTLMHRIFPAAAPSRAYVATGLGRLPSPPPSPLPREESIRMEKILRVGLDATVFHGKGADRCEEVQRARDMLISRLSQAARMRRLVALEEEQE